MSPPAGQPLPISLPPGLQRALTDRPADQDTWRVAIDWCSMTGDPWIWPLRDALRWADRVAHDAHGLRAGFTHGETTQWMRWVPAGGAILGSPIDEPGRQTREQQRRVAISRAFWLGESAVDQALFRQVTALSASRFCGETRPVEQVTHDDATRFCTALNLQYTGLHVRLPTEAEWEIACRAGTETATWAGEVLLIDDYEAVPADDIAWYGGTSDFRGTRPAEAGLPNPLGLRDMLGNVWEWCADAYLPAPPTGRDPQGAAESVERVIRGGSWRSFASDLRAARRGHARVTDRLDDVGFRLAQTARVD